MLDCGTVRLKHAKAYIKLADKENDGIDLAYACTHPRQGVFGKLFDCLF